MSQPRRRRRSRRRRSGGQPQQQPKQDGQQQRQAAGRAPSGNGEATRKRSRRRGKRRSGEGGRPGSPKSSEDLVRALPRERPENLVLEPDGKSLEGVIGELQSEYGVPQYPQEYRITIKIAEGDTKTEAPAPVEAKANADAPRAAGGAPVREKAPAAPLMAREGSDGPKRSRRRRRRKRGGGGGGGAPSSS